MILSSGCNGGAMTADWRDINLANWESRVPVHTGPGGYDLTRFDDPDYLSPVVRYDLPRLGRLDGLDVVHLQSHIGTDTVSLGRLGTQSMVGLDFSPAALQAARELAERARAEVTFTEGDVYDAVGFLGGHRFDLVYTGIGAICWLPSIRRWAEVVAGLLRMGGRLFMREGHPVLWSMSDPRPDGLLVVEYPYFEGEGVVFVEEQSYTGTGTVAHPDRGFQPRARRDIHRAAGRRVDRYCPRRTSRGAVESPGRCDGVEPRLGREFILTTASDRMPLTYTLQAVRVA